MNLTHGLKWETDKDLRFNPLLCDEWIVSSINDMNMCNKALHAVNLRRLHVPAPHTVSRPSAAPLQTTIHKADKLVCMSLSEISI